MSTDPILVGGVPLPQIWAGHHLEVTLDLYHMQSRWYDPRSGQFISLDPTRFGAGDANLYRYTGNDPVNAVDPNGRESENLQGIFAKTQPISGSTVLLPQFVQEQLSPSFTSIEEVRLAEEREANNRRNRERTQANLDSQPVFATESVRPDGTPFPRIEGQTRFEADTSRLRKLQFDVLTNRIMSPEDRQEFERLSLIYSSSLDHFNIAVGSLAGFAGGYVPPRGTLNVQGPKVGTGIDYTIPPSSGHNCTLGDHAASAMRL